MAQLLTELPRGYLSGLFQMQQCLETYLHAVLIAQGVPSPRRLWPISIQARATPNRASW